MMLTLLDLMNGTHDDIRLGCIIRVDLALRSLPDPLALRRLDDAHRALALEYQDRAEPAPLEWGPYHQTTRSDS